MRKVYPYNSSHGKEFQMSEIETKELVSTMLCIDYSSMLFVS